MTFQIRMRFVIAHSVFAIPAWAWLYVAKDHAIYGVFALCHAALFGIAVGALCRDRIEGRRLAVPAEGAWERWNPQ